MASWKSWLADDYTSTSSAADTFPHVDPGGGADYLTASDLTFVIKSSGFSLLQFENTSGSENTATDPQTIRCNDYASTSTGIHHEIIAKISGQTFPDESVLPQEMFKAETSIAAPEDANISASSMAQIAIKKFDASSAESVVAFWEAPEDLASPPNIKFIMEGIVCSSAFSSQGVAFGLKGVRIADDAVMTNSSYGSEAIATVSGKSYAQYDRVRLPVTGVTVSSIVGGDLVKLKLTRKVDSSSDTYASDFGFRRLKLKFNRKFGRKLT